MENKKVFFYANILLDVIITERKGNQYAKILWKYLVLNNIEIVISEDILTKVFYISKNKKNTLIFFELIQSRWKIIPFWGKVIGNSISLSLEKNLDLEDVLQSLSAKENGCQVLITNDKKFYDCDIEVLSTEAFLDKYND
ncbi:MAG: PIN domain-containing protein [Sulfurovum sp.]|nr:MAG: PIN domain-containing protein [Sulfurovum sp.]